MEEKEVWNSKERSVIVEMGETNEWKREGEMGEKEKWNKRELGQ